VSPSAPELAELLLAATGDGVVTFDGDLVCTYWGPGMERMFGVPAAAAVGQPLPAWLAATDGDGAALARVLAGETVRIERRGPEQDVDHTYEVRFAPWRADDGAVRGGVGILRDTSLHQQAERRVHETESRFRIMADAAPVLLWMSGPDALCTFFNQTWLDFTGRTLEEEWGVGWAEGVHFEDFQACIDTYMAAFAERRPFEMEYRLRRADGQYRWILDRGTPRWEQDGRFAGYIGSCADITDRKDVELELTRAVSLRDEFLSIASHELRTPLAALRLQMDILTMALGRHAHDSPLGGRIASSARAAQAQVGRLTKLVDRLLDISSFPEGRLDLEREELDLVPVVRNVVDGMREAARDAGCDLHFSAPEAMRGAWDRMRVEQLVTNLVANAMKFGAKCPIDVVVSSEEGPAARITVTDRGIGIDPRSQRRIFERFERAVSARNFGGLGLGLWVAKQIADAHEGTISVDSKPGEGATFTVVLPLGAPGLARRSA
jgi:PAS domain S-box-containing protein